MDESNLTFRKISNEEIKKLKPLFPDSSLLWSGYRRRRLEQLKEGARDIFVIEYDKKFIGEVTALYRNYRLEEETIPGVRAYLAAFRVKKEYQGKGLGQRLLGHTLAALKNEGYTQFTIGVEEDNRVAKHIYFNLGFTQPRAQASSRSRERYTLYLKEI